MGQANAVRPTSIEGSFTVYIIICLFPSQQLWCTCVDADERAGDGGRHQFTTTATRVTSRQHRAARAEHPGQSVLLSDSHPPTAQLHV